MSSIIHAPDCYIPTEGQLPEDLKTFFGRLLCFIDDVVSDPRKKGEKFFFSRPRRDDRDNSTLH